MGVSIDPIFVAGDGLSKLQVAFVDHVTGLAKDITGLTPKLTFRIVSPDGLSTVLQAAATITMDIVSPATGGVAEYQFATAELLGGSAYEVVTTANLVVGHLEWDAYLWDGSKPLTNRVTGVEEVRGRLAVAS